MSTALVEVNDGASFLASLEEAKRFLAACSCIDDVKLIRDKAQAVAVWARAQKDAGELEVAAGELRVRATIRMGELLPAKGTNHGGDRKSINVPERNVDLVSRKDAHVARALASTPAPVVERVIRESKARGEAPTVAAVLRAKKDDAKAARVVDVKARAASEALEDGLYDDLALVPGGRYRTIYGDPPWSYDDDGCSGAAADHYPTMTLDGMLALDVGRLAHPEGAHLWLWVTWPKLREGEPQDLLAAWGFTWRSEAVWRKTGRMGLGRLLRKDTELIILATRGEVPILVNDARDWIETAPGAHSEKPPEARALVERCSPGPRIEIFARSVPAGWDAFGNQCRRIG